MPRLCTSIYGKYTETAILAKNTVISSENVYFYVYLTATKIYGDFS